MATLISGPQQFTPDGLRFVANKASPRPSSLPYSALPYVSIGFFLLAFVEEKKKEGVDRE